MHAPCMLHVPTCSQLHKNPALQLGSKSFAGTCRCVPFDYTERTRTVREWTLPYIHSTLCYSTTPHTSSMTSAPNAPASPSSLEWFSVLLWLLRTYMASPLTMLLLYRISNIQVTLDLTKQLTLRQHQVALELHVRVTCAHNSITIHHITQERELPCT